MAAGTLTGTATAAPDSEQLEFSAHPHALLDRIKDLDGNGNGTFAPDRPSALRIGGPLHNDIVKLSEVLDKADRATPDGDACGRDQHPKSGFCWNKGDNLYFLGDMLWNAFSLHSRFPWDASPFSFLCQEQKQGSELLPYLLCLLSH